MESLTMSRWKEEKIAAEKKQYRKYVMLLVAVFIISAATN